VSPKKVQRRRAQPGEGRGRRQVAEKYLEVARPPSTLTIRASRARCTDTADAVSLLSFMLLLTNSCGRRAHGVWTFDDELGGGAQMLLQQFGAAGRVS
jgi:hypothetical protein